MLKVTILLLICTLVSYAVMRCIIASMSKLEKFQAAMFEQLPTRYYISFCVTALLSIATVTCLIITIITW